MTNTTSTSVDMLGHNALWTQDGAFALWCPLSPRAIVQSLRDQRSPALPVCAKTGAMLPLDPSSSRQPRRTTNKSERRSSRADLTVSPCDQRSASGNARAVGTPSVSCVPNQIAARPLTSSVRAASLGGHLGDPALKRGELGGGTGGRDSLVPGATADSRDQSLMDGAAR